MIFLPKSANRGGNQPVFYLDAAVQMQIPELLLSGFQPVRQRTHTSTYVLPGKFSADELQRKPHLTIADSKDQGKQEQEII